MRQYSLNSRRWLASLIISLLIAPGAVLSSLADDGMGMPTPSSSIDDNGAAGSDGMLNPSPTTSPEDEEEESQSAEEVDTPVPEGSMADEAEGEEGRVSCGDVFCEKDEKCCTICSPDGKEVKECRPETDTHCSISGHGEGFYSACNDVCDYDDCCYEIEEQGDKDVIMSETPIYAKDKKACCPDMSVLENCAGVCQQRVDKNVCIPCELDNWCGFECCGEGEECLIDGANGTGVGCCPKGRELCADECCGPNQHCSADVVPGLAVVSLCCHEGYVVCNMRCVSKRQLIPDDAPPPFDEDSCCKGDDIWDYIKRECVKDFV